jgi:hypothetical protein
MVVTNDLTEVDGQEPASKYYKQTKWMSMENT